MSDWLTLKNEIGLTLRPIDAWPGTLRTVWRREVGPYSAPLKETLKTLRKELNALSATNIVLQIAIREGDLRLDGLPRSGAKAEHAGVILCFDVRGGSRRRAFDRFTKWDQNLRALALNLEHLRLANLYGVEGDEQQYAGWRALPSPSVIHDADVESAAQILTAFAGGNQFNDLLLWEAESFRNTYRELAMQMHPDRGGNAADFRTMQAAAEIMKEYHAKMEQETTDAK